MALDKLNSSRYKALRKVVFARDGHVCAYCGIDEGEMHIDHIIPRKAGGTHSMDNLQVLCKPCNLRKSAKSEGAFLAQSPYPLVFIDNMYPMESKPMPDSPFTVRPSTI